MPNMEGVQADMQSFTTTQPPSQAHIIPGAEPVPDWKEAKNVWGVAWNIHWIGLGVLFSALALTAVVSLVRSNTQRGLGRKPFVVAINTLLLILGVARAFYLLVDPYESRQNGVKMPRWLAQLLYNVAFPCLSSAFCLIFLVFLEVAKLRLIPKKLQNVRFLVIVISFHFAIVLFAEVAGVIKPDLAVPIIICQLFFIVWGFLLSAGFIYGGLKVIYQARNVKRQLSTLAVKYQEKKVKKQLGANVSKVAKISLVTSCLGLALSVVQLYSLIDVYRFYSDISQPPSPWLWWAFQTCFRLVEIAMACTIAYCVMQPSGRNSAESARRKSTTHQKILDEKSGNSTV